jgi:hypothetical protein
VNKELRLVRKINHPDVFGHAHADCFPFRRQHVLAMLRGIDPYLQYQFAAAAGCAAARGVFAKSTTWKSRAHASVIVGVMSYANRNWSLGVDKLPH